MTDLGYANISGIVGLVRGATSDLAAGVPNGTLLTLVSLGYAEIAQGVIRPTHKAEEQVKAWESAPRAEEVPKADPKPEKIPPSPRAYPKAPKEGDLRSITAVAGAAPKFQTGATRAEHYSKAISAAIVQEYLDSGGSKTDLKFFEIKGWITII